MSLIDIKSNLSVYRFPHNTKSILINPTQNNTKTVSKNDTQSGIDKYINKNSNTHIKKYTGRDYNTTKLYSSLNLPFPHTAKDGRDVNTIFPHTAKDGRDVNKIIGHKEKHSNFVPQQINIPIKTGRDVNTIFLHTPKTARVVNTIFPHTAKDGRNVNTTFPHTTKDGRDVNTIFPHTTKDGRDVNTIFLHTAKDGRDVNNIFPHSNKDGRDVNTIFPHTTKDGRDVNNIFPHTDKDGRDVNNIFPHTDKDGRDVNNIFPHTDKDGRDVNNIFPHTDKDGRDVTKPSNHTILTKSNTSGDLLALLNNQYATFNDRYSLENTAYRPSASLFHQPFCIRGIQRKGKESKTNDLHYSDGPFGLFNELSRSVGKAGKLVQTFFDAISNIGGLTTHITAAYEDAIRLAKWNLSTQGIVFNIKNAALALMNPKIDGIRKLNRIKVGLLMIANATLAKVGIYSADYGASLLTEKYGKYSYAHRDDDNTSTSTDAKPYSTDVYSNRLLNLYNDIHANTSVKDKLTKTKSAASAATGGDEGSAIDTSLSKTKVWDRLSGCCGPNSFFGIGRTTILRYYDSTNYNELINAVREPNTKSQVDVYNETINANKKYSDIYNEYSEVTDDTAESITETNGAILKNSPISTTKDNFYKNISKSGKFTTSSFDKLDKRTNRTNLSKNEYVPSGSFFNKRSPTDKITYTNKYTNSYTNSNLGLDSSNSGILDGYNGKTLAGWFGYPSGIDGKTITQIGQSSFIKDGQEFGYGTGGNTINGSSPWLLSHDANFMGDKINAIDTGNFIATDWGFGEDNNVYNPTGSGYTKYRDLVSFYFMDGDLYTKSGDIYDRHARSVLVFRAYITNFDDQYSPKWDSIDIMGRPDPAYIYKGMTRAINFSFIVAASSRSEMIPMWRKLNYLASYTAPKYTTKERRMVGPFMRLTLGDLFRQTPIILTSLRYTIQESYPWDVALDKDLTNDAKQLPQVIDVQCSANVISDYRPQFGGRFYSLSLGGGTNSKAGADNSTQMYGAGNTIGNWLQDSTSERHAVTNANKNKSDKAKLVSHNSDMQTAYQQ